MFSWRVTKYDPQFRDNLGAYTVNDWTSITQVGSKYYDVILKKPTELTMENYIEAENAYVNSALQFFGESKLKNLKVVGLENLQIALDFWKNNLHGIRNLCPDLNWLRNLKNFQLVDQIEVSILCRLNLRETLWCKLEYEDKFSIRFGYDYYMYIYSIHSSLKSIEFARKQGLFVERFETSKSI